MSVDYFDCDVCGESVCECGYHVTCGCGRHWCSDECANEDGFNRSVVNKWGEPTCKYCREEDFEDGVLLEFVLEELEITREDLIDSYKNSLKTDEVKKYCLDCGGNFVNERCENCGSTIICKGCANTGIFIKGNPCSCDAGKIVREIMAKESGIKTGTERK